MEISYLQYKIVLFVLLFVCLNLLPHTPCPLSPFFFISLLYLRPWPEDLSHSYLIPAGTVPSLSSDQRRDWRLDLSLGKEALYCLMFSMADTLSNSPLPLHSLHFLCTHPTSPGQDGWRWSKTYEGRGNLCPFGSGDLLALAEIIIVPFPFFPRSGVGLEVGSNSIAAKLHSSCPDHPALTPKAPFPTDQISLPCLGENILFLNLFSNLNAI